MTPWKPDIKSFSKSFFGFRGWRRFAWEFLPIDQVGNFAPNKMSKSSAKFVTFWGDEIWELPVGSFGLNKKIKIFFWMYETLVILFVILRLGRTRRVATRTAKSQRYIGTQKRFSPFASTLRLSDYENEVLKKNYTYFWLARGLKIESDHLLHLWIYLNRTKCENVR